MNEKRLPEYWENAVAEYTTHSIDCAFFEPNDGVSKDCTCAVHQFRDTVRTALVAHLNRRAPQGETQAGASADVEAASEDVYLVDEVVKVAGSDAVAEAWERIVAQLTPAEPSDVGALVERLDALAFRIGCSGDDDQDDAGAVHDAIAALRSRAGVGDLDLLVGLPEREEAPRG